MLRTPRSTPRSGLAGLGLVLLAVLVAGGLVYFLFAAPSGRRSEAAERGTKRATAEAPGKPDDGRAAPPVELVPAGVSATNTPTNEAPVATAAPTAEATPASQELGLVAAENTGKVEGPDLKYVRGEGKTEVINGKQERRERRTDRRERETEAAATGVQPTKKVVESPKKNGDRSQIQRKGQQGGKPKPKKDAPEEPAPQQDG
jgi:hypothetical protein